MTTPRVINNKSNGTSIITTTLDDAWRKQSGIRTVGDVIPNLLG